MSENTNITAEVIIRFTIPDAIDRESLESWYGEGEGIGLTHYIAELIDSEGLFGVVDGPGELIRVSEVREDGEGPLWWDLERHWIEAWERMASYIHLINREKGFWDEPRNKSEALMLVVSELAEAQEALRAGNPPDDKIPQFPGAAAELADAVIRLLDMAEGFGWPVGEAIVAKVNYNKKRPHKHGKEF